MKIGMVRPLLLVLIFLFPTYGFCQSGLDQRVGELSQQISNEMTQYQKTTIAVAEFSDLNGNITDFGRFLAEELVTRLFQTGKFKVIERQLLTKVVREQKLSLTGLVDPSSAKQLGKILGVDAIVSGTITDLAQSLKVNARLISTETGEIFAVASTEIFKDESVMKLMGTGTTTQLSGEPTSPQPEQISASPKPKSWKVQSNGFAFELVSAKRESSSLLRVEILVTNQGDNDQDFSLYAKDRKDATTRLFDANGNEYWPSKLIFGNQQTSGEIRNKIPVNVPTKAVFVFDNVPEGTTNFTALDVGVVTDYFKLGIWRVQLRNFSVK